MSSVKMWKLYFFLISVTLRTHAIKEGWAIVGSSIAHFFPCEGYDALIASIESDLPPGEENQYDLFLKEDFTAYSKMNLRFDSDATVSLRGSNISARIRAYPELKLFEVRFFKAADSVYLKVKGPASGTVPYLESVEINTVEYCNKPKKGVLDGVILGVSDTAEISLSQKSAEGCGRRKVQHTELIVNGSPTKAGDWPWHAAIYRFERSRIDYICGGTLLNEYFILTAAHCVANKGQAVLPETRNVVLGKYNLVGGDIAPQEKEIHKIIMHENFDAKTVAKDIALMKLKTAAEFTDFVQPACLWSSDITQRLTQSYTPILGTVVGWGFDHTDSLSTTLQQAVIPQLPETVCIKSNPIFFASKLDDTVFCAGLTNGTSVCNGDSGGGFHVFVPDQKGYGDDVTGAWYVKGVVSIGVKRRDAPICDPDSYSLFTDVSKYGEWIKKHLDE